MASFKMRVPDDELAAWQRAADAVGLSIAAYVRGRVSGRIALPAPTLDRATGSTAPDKRRRTTRTRRAAK